jgi:hypothetical protein
MVTRESVEFEVSRRKQRRRKATPPPEGCIPIEEVMTRLGMTRVGVLALSSSAVRLIRTPDYRFYVDEASLEKYLDGKAEV